MVINHEDMTRKNLIIENDIVESIIDEADPLFSQLTDQKIWKDTSIIYK